MLASFLSGEFLLHIPCWLHFYLESFSYTSHGGFIFPWGVSLTHPLLAFIFKRGIIFIWGVSLTHPMLASFLSREFLLHIPCCFEFYARSFSYTSHAGFVFLSVEFSLQIPCWRHFCLGNFSYTSRAGFIFNWGVSRAHRMPD